MITEDYVSFEVAKLLKEKKFNGLCNAYYDCFTADNFHNDCEPTDFNSIDTKIRNIVSAPTLQMAMKWLREVHKININVLYDAQRFVKTDGTTEDVDVYEVDIITKNGSIYIGNYNHYESACEAAIKYCLTNLIK